MSRAFTLMELLLTMGLLSVTALLFISYTGDVGEASVDALSRKIQSDVRYAQQLATSSGTNHGVVFIPAGNYTVYSGSTSNPVSDPLDKSPMVENTAEFGNVQVATSFQVEFDRWGRPVIGGGGNIEVVADSGASRRIYIIDNTGAVVVDILGYGSGCSCRMCAESR